MKHTVRMLVSDLDRTLLGSDGLLSDYTVGVLQRCWKQDIIVAFATARSVSAARAVTSAFKPDYIIANLGATIAKYGGVLRSRPVPAEQLRVLLQAFLAHPDIATICAQGPKFLYTNSKESPGAWGQEWNPLHNDFSRPPRVDISKLAIECGNPEAVEALAREFPDVRFTGNTGEAWYQIVRAGVDKAEGLAFVAEHLQIDLAQVVAFGDDHSDIPLLEACGLGVAVANANSAVQNIAGAVCGPHHADGVAHWIEENILACLE